MKEIIKQLREGNGEANHRYSTYCEGEYVSVQPLVDSFLSVKTHLDHCDRRIKYLEEENKRLKSEHYEKKELAEMRAELDEARAELRRGFGISKEEDAAISKWIEEHEKEKHGVGTKVKYRYSGAIGGAYTYSFLPTSIGMIGTIKCSCGAEFNFREM